MCFFNVFPVLPIGVIKNDDDDDDDINSNNNIQINFTQTIFLDE